MSSFTIAFSTALMMLGYAIPGYILTKTRKIAPSMISPFAVLLVCACSPCQMLDAIQRIEYSAENTKYLFIMLAMGFILMGAMLGLAFVVLRKKQNIVRYRILTLAAAFGNSGFMGIPLLEALMPEYPQAVAYASMFFVAINVLMWTAASAIIAHDIKYVSLKKIFLNPCTVTIGFGLILYFARFKITGQVQTIVTGFSKMSTPLCMLILGMRLGVVNIVKIFTDLEQYIAVAVKLFVFPLFALLVGKLLPLDANFVRGLYIIACVPVGNLVLSFAEMLGEGQDTAANVVLLSTILSVLTIPVMMLLI